LNSKKDKESMREALDKMAEELTYLGKHPK
jgi:hypothetical protein